MLWSLIPWRRLLKLALPFIREYFFGKFNFKGYFIKHPVVTFCIIVITLATMSMMFITEQAVYHATKSTEYQSLLAAEQAKVNALTLKVKDLEKAQCKPTKTVPVQDSRKEVVLVPPAPPVRKAILKNPVHKPPLPKPAPSREVELVALPTHQYPTLKDKLKALREDN